MLRISYNNDNLNIFWRKKFGRYKNKNICQYYHKKDSNRERETEKERESKERLRGKIDSMRKKERDKERERHLKEELERGKEKRETFKGKAGEIDR